ncbi:MAG: right-handed parallel beta-helix repeat-containing protein [Limisphaerales bacterium]
MLRRVVRTIIGLFVLTVAIHSQAALKFYVATNGNDGWSGHFGARRKNGKDGPLASLPEAIRRARSERRGGSVEIILRDGVHVLAEPLVLTAEDSHLSISAYRNENPVVSGQTVISGWARVEGNTNMWHAQVTDEKLKQWNFRELFVNNHRKQRARTPNDGFFHLVGASAGASNLVKFAGTDFNAEWAKSGEVELVALQLWAGSRNRIIAVDTNSHVVTLGGQAITENKEDNGRYFIENARDALDKPGEWFFDAKSGEVLYWTEADEDMAKARVTVPHLSDLVVLNGTSNAPVVDIALRGLTFADADWRLAPNGYCDVQAAVYIRGVVHGEFAKDCAVEKCEFVRLGGYAIDFGSGCQRDRVVGNVIHDMGAGGLRLGDMDRKAAFATPSGHCEITDNSIYNIGIIYPPAVGIMLFHTAGNHVAHNEIHHTFYTAISIGWSWGYQPTPTGTNIIEFNHLHDIGQKMLSDMGGIYTLGLEPGTVLRNNLIHDVNALAYGGWGLYTDEGSSGIVLENNVVYRCGSANFNQHYGKENVLRNNIFAFGRDAQLARTRPEEHISFFFTNNIIFYDAGSLFTGNWSGTNYVIDHNVYFDSRPDGATRPVEGVMTWRGWRKKGRDLHSIFADPLFVAPDKYDFTLKPTSPARKLGFHPIDMRGVGVRKQFARTTKDETD